MPESLTTCTWSVCAGGYEWVDGWPSPDRLDEPPVRYLVEHVLSDYDASIRRVYNPLITRPRISEKFAALKPTEKRIQGFANSYGMLGYTCTESVAYRGPDGSLRVDQGESFRSWQHALQAFQETRLLVRLLAEEDEERLATEPLVRRLLCGRLEMPFPDDKRASYAARLDRVNTGSQSVLSRANRIIQIRINDYLSTLASPRLMVNPSLERPGIYLTPHSLLGAIWLQFALWFVAGTEGSPCEVCGEYFRRDTARSDRRYCSDACKMKAYRQRRGA